MKKVLALTLALCLLVPAIVLGETLKIGVYEPASGDSGAGGKQEILGVQYANKETPTIEVGGVTYDIELVYADNGSDTSKAPSAAQSLVAEGVSVILGSYGSGVSIAGSQYFADAGIPAIGLSCTNPQVTAGNSHYFRICFLDPFQGTVLANYAAKALGSNMAYALGELGNDYDQGLVHYFKEAFEAMGGTVIDDSFPTGTSDFTSYLNNATMMGCSVFFCPVSIAYSTQIVQQASSLNVAFPIIGSDTLDSNVVANAAKGTAVSVTCSTFYQEGANPDFDNGFKAWLNSDATALANNGGNDQISAVSVMGYDGYYTALAAIKAADSVDSKAIMAALPTTEYDGVTGHIAFDAVGDAVRNSAFLKKVNNETADWEFVAEQKVD